MAKIVRIVNISREGQITLPKEVMEKLKSDVLRIVITDEGILLEPVHDVGGSLKQYATRIIPIEEARDQAWTEVVGDLYGAFKDDPGWSELFEEIERSRSTNPSGS
jgi:bifunctional DNA-binding transcriptional regulator/antitoxin component of YhaV-PrlF toxin-antitoxin module